MSHPDVAIIGGGILGLAAALKLLQHRPGAAVVVLEKEPEVGRHQSGHNSGVLHAGLSYEPGSAKARLAVDGIRQMVAYCRAAGVPHEICGKLVVATDASQLPALRALMARGAQNGLLGLTWLEASGIRDVEPHAAGVAAISVPEEGIVDYQAVCRALEKDIRSLGGEVRTDSYVHRLEREGGGWTLVTRGGTLRARLLVNCAGLYADRVARLAGVATDLSIMPFRGRYYRLRADRRHLVRHLIYPVPDPRFPFLGVHLTRRIGGEVDAGPNAFLAGAREGYRGRDVNLRDLAEMAGNPALWRFVRRNPRLCTRELGLTVSRRRFAQALRRLVPAVEAGDLEPGGSGVRAQAVRPDGSLVSDFVFATSETAVHLLNAPSPGATASLAIGDEVSRRVLALLPHPSPRLAGRVR